MKWGRTEPLSVSKMPQHRGRGDLQKELHALPLSLHVPGPRMGEAEVDTIGSEEASTQYCPVPTH